MAAQGLRARPEFWPVTLLSLALVAVLGGWSAASYAERTRTGPSCAERTSLRIAAAPSIARPVAEVAAVFAARERCLDVEIEARESADVLRDLARTIPAGTPGLPSASPLPSTSVPSVPAATGEAPAATGEAPAATGEAPDVWLPESTLWLRRARAAGAFQVPAEGVSVAGTPIVIALDSRSSAGKDRDLTWRELLTAARPVLPVVLPDPATSPIGFAALVGIRDLGKAVRPDDAAAGAATTMRRLAPRTVSLSGETPPPADDKSAVVTTEQAVLLGSSQVAVYAPEQVPGPDYPYAALTTGPGRDGATGFLRALLADEGARAITGHGLRTPAGGPPTTIRSGAGIRAAAYPPAALPAEPDAVGLLNAWGGVHISARMLAVFDISGSMEAQVPGSADTRMSATVKAAQGGAQLLLSTTEIGIWEFSTDLDGDREYREVVPVGPVGPRRDEIVAELGRMRVKPNGQTGLYETALAAYRDATRNWTPGRINMVLILTDGADDNASGISRAELLRELGTLVDRKRPVPILFIGVGPDIDAAELGQIAKATGGQVALTDKPAGIQQIFFTSLAEFSCLPPKCRR